MAIFHSSGKVSVSIQLLKIFVNDGPIMELANFRSLQGTLSNPIVVLVGCKPGGGYSREFWIGVCREGS